MVEKRYARKTRYQGVRNVIWGNSYRGFGPPGSGLFVSRYQLLGNKIIMRILLGTLIAVGSFTYLLPTGIAVGRGRTNTMSIFMVNLFLGWTLIGWVVALAWSVATDTVKTSQ